MAMDDDEFDCPEDHAWFNESDCTCTHTAEEHSWTGCWVDGCDCEACWEY